MTEEHATGDDHDEDGTSTRSWTRRGLIAGVAAAGAGAAAAVVGGAAPAGATEGDPLVVGEANTATGETSLTTSSGIAFLTYTSTTGAAALQGVDNSDGGYGVYATSLAGNAVYGQMHATSGISGAANQAAGIVGDSDLGPGVVGASSGDHGVYGLTNLETYAGVYGSDQSAGGGYGLVGQSQTGIGVLGTTSASGEGIAGIIGSAENGYGVYASGGLAPLFLFPAASAGAPTTGLHGVGEVYTDSRGVLYACVAGGTPGTWVQLAAGPTGYASGASCLLPTAIRLFDSREADPPAAPTRAAGPLPGGSSPQTLQVTGTEVGGVSVPIGAVAVLGNLTATGAAGPGYLATAAGGSAQPSTSSLNYQATTSIANAVTVPLSDTGQIAIWSNTRTNVLFDATGFIG